MRALGLGHGRLAGRDLARPFHGVRTTDASLAPALAVLPLLRDGDRLSHTTAAEVLGVPLPGSTEGLVHVTAGIGRVAPRGRGVIGHSHDGRGVDLVHGIPISRPGELFLELAGVLGHDALVAAGDHLVHLPRFAEPSRPHTDLAALAAVCGEAGRRDVRRARAALADIRMGVASPRETRLRLEIARAGLPEPGCEQPDSVPAPAWTTPSPVWSGPSAPAAGTPDRSARRSLPFRRDCANPPSDAGFTRIRASWAGRWHVRRAVIRWATGKVKDHGCAGGSRDI